jgi:23S rRNA (uracil1939-C5)-methyltransferase
MTELIKAETPVYGGYVISRGQGVIFVKGAVPGEVVEVSIDEKKRDFSLASVKEVIEPSPDRVEPECPYFGDCGGCQLQYISYEKQVSMKNDILLDCLRRIGGIEVETLPPLTGGNFRYRIRGQFKVSNHGKMGFFRESTRDVVDIRECPLMADGLNEMFKKTRSANLKGIREIHITLGDKAVVLIKGRGFDEKTAGEFADMGFAGVAFEEGSYRGAGFVVLSLMGLAYTVSPWSFIQSNWELNIKIAGLIKEGLLPLEGKTVLDLYAGGGNFTLPMSDEAAEIMAVEENPDSVKDGQRNISINKIKNYRFVKARAEKLKIKTAIDIIIVDPPRPGLTTSAIETILGVSPGRLVYVSCNPSTLARDLKKLCGKYTIDSIRAVDSFPNTYHIESVTFLTLRP